MKKVTFEDRRLYVIDTNGYPDSGALLLKELENFYGVDYLPHPDYVRTERYKYFDAIQEKILSSSKEYLQNILRNKSIGEKNIISFKEMRKITNAGNKKEKTNIEFNDFEKWWCDQGYSIRWFARACLYRKLTTPKVIDKHMALLRERFESGSNAYKEHIIDNEVIWSETPYDNNFWQTLYDGWRRHFNELKEKRSKSIIDWQVESEINPTGDTTNKDHQKNTGEEGEEMKEIDLLARAYYTQKGKRKEAATKAIEEFFKKHMIVMNESSSLPTIAGCPWTPQNTTFTGNIAYTSLVQKFFMHADGLTPEEYLELISLYRHEKFNEHSWVKPECKQSYTEYLNGGSKKKTFWKSNTKKIYFNAEEKSVHFVDRKNKKEYVYTFTLEELV